VWELWVVGGKCVGDKQVDGKIVGPEISGSWNHGSINGSNSQRVIRRISREKELNWLLISYEGTWRSISLKPLARLENES
ncbi:hypothetical protein Tco_1494426, partial [Tanacetum coccineum]